MLPISNLNGILCRIIVSVCKFIRNKYCAGWKLLLPLHRELGADIRFVSSNFRTETEFFVSVFLICKIWVMSKKGYFEPNLHYLQIRLEAGFAASGDFDLVKGDNDEEFA